MLVKNADLIYAMTFMFDMIVYHVVKDVPMSSKKKQFHLYLDEELYNALMEIAPGYGQASELLRGLLAKHVEEARRETKKVQ